MKFPHKQAASPSSITLLAPKHCPVFRPAPDARTRAVPVTSSTRAGAALIGGHVRETLLDVLAASGPGGLVALGAFNFAAHED
eukprot:CAMPEP_0174893366 /NCGR_PEP_ID=MMETSP0167-20121228/8187_1 /TAXON_ID=38298 /ORGANISM="Rhodella maculata, Strain CCMP736" /LENGTH=82 /DNA_ID=CAMNT_0016132135 /DNA_START=78 /DNA_END=326 /DNA_ORIENTATION=-